MIFILTRMHCFSPYYTVVRTVSYHTNYFGHLHAFIDFIKKNNITKQINNIIIIINITVK